MRKSKIFFYTQVDKVEEDPEGDAITGARICRVPGDAGCTFVFKYELERDGTGGDVKKFKIVAQKERDCPTPINLLGKFTVTVADQIKEYVSIIRLTVDIFCQLQEWLSE